MAFILVVIFSIETIGYGFICDAKGTICLRSPLAFGKGDKDITRVEPNKWRTLKLVIPFLPLLSLILVDIVNYYKKTSIDTEKIISDVKSRDILTAFPELSAVLHTDPGSPGSVRYTSLLIEFYSQYKDMGSMARAHFDKACENAPVLAIEYFLDYKDYFSGEEQTAILTKAIKKVSQRGRGREWSIIKYYPIYYAMVPEAREYFDMVCAMNPALAIAYFNDYKSVLSQKEQESILTEAVKNLSKGYPLEKWDLIKYYPIYYSIVPDAKTYFDRACEDDPILAIDHFGDYKQVFSEEEQIGILTKAVKSLSEGSLLDKHILITSYPVYYKIVHGAEGFFDKVCERYPILAIAYLDHYKGAFSEEELTAILTKAVKSISQSRTDTARNLIFYYCRYCDRVADPEVYFYKACEDNPDRAIRYFHNYKDKFSEEEQETIITDALKLQPDAILDIDLEDYPITNNDPAIQLFLTIKNTGYGIEKTRLLAVSDEIVNGNMTLEQAEKITQDEKEYFKALIKIKNKPNHLGRETVEDELRDISLYIVRQVIDLRIEHAVDEVAFKIVEDMSADEIYTLMVYGADEIVISSYNGLFERLLERMKRENINGQGLLNKVSWNKFRVFVRINASSGRLKEFMEKTMNVSQREAFLGSFVKGLGVERDKLQQGMIIADVFGILGQLREYQDMYKKLIDMLRDEYENTDDLEAKKIYGILLGMFGNTTQLDNEWVKEISKKYNLSTLNSISTDKLFNKDNVNIQQHIFYNDEDGAASFKSFISSYPQHSIEDKGSFIIITLSSNRRTIKIYANKPASEDGVEKIKEALKDKTIHILVHRGHSYYIDDTIEEIPEGGVSIFYAGSCGGYNQIREILSKNPHTHIISTKRTGTQGLNNAILWELNKTLLFDGSIVWQTLWRRLEDRLGTNPDFAGYVRPDLNMGVIFTLIYIMETGSVVKIEQDVILEDTERDNGPSVAIDGQEGMNVEIPLVEQHLYSKMTIEQFQERIEFLKMQKAIAEVTLAKALENGDTVKVSDAEAKISSLEASIKIAYYLMAEEIIEDVLGDDNDGKGVEQFMSLEEIFSDSSAARDINNSL